MRTHSKHLNNKKKPIGFDGINNIEFSCLFLYEGTKSYSELQLNKIINTTTTQ